MKATLSNTSLKRLAKVIRFLGKVCGNEIFIHGTKESLNLKAINSSETAICIAKFNDCFFLSYDITAADTQATIIDGADGFDEANNCKISTRLLLNAFKNYKNITSCKLHLDSTQERFFIDCVKSRRVSILHACDLLENDDLEEFGRPTSSVSSITFQCSDICSLLNNIPKNQKELLISTYSDHLEIGNYISHPDKDVETLRLHFKIDKSELVNYEVEGEHRLIVCAKDFSSFLEQAGMMSEELTLTFVKPGKPLIATAVANDGLLTLETAMSTLREETLKKQRKPPEIQSYRALMGSFIVNRKAADAEDVSLRDLSESEMNRVMSPKIESCGTSKNGTSHDNKRKIQEKLSSVVDEPPRKRKSTESQHASQQELLEVTNILAALQNENFDFEEDEVEVVEKVQSVDKNLKETQIYEEPESRIPFQINDMNFPTEEFVPNELHQSAVEKSNQSRKITSNSLQIKKVTQIQKKQVNNFLKSTFDDKLSSPKNHTDGDPIETLAANSDSD